MNINLDNVKNTASLWYFCDSPEIRTCNRSSPQRGNLL